MPRRHGPEAHRQQLDSLWERLPPRMWQLWDRQQRVSERRGYSSMVLVRHSIRQFLRAKLSLQYTRLKKAEPFRDRRSGRLRPSAVISPKTNGPRSATLLFDKSRLTTHTLATVPNVLLREFIATLSLVPGRHSDMPGCQLLLGVKP